MLLCISNRFFHNCQAAVKSNNGREQCDRENSHDHKSLSVFFINYNKKEDNQHLTSFHWEFFSILSKKVEMQYRT